MLDEWNSDKDGKIAKAEAPDRIQQQFDKLDLDKNGYLEKNELEAFLRMRKARRAVQPTR